MAKNEPKAVEPSGSEVMNGIPSDRLRFRRFEWRRKGERKDQHNTHVVSREQYFRAIHHKKNRRGRFPILPVLPDGEQTTVMIKNIPSKYKYVSSFLFCFFINSPSLCAFILIYFILFYFIFYDWYSRDMLVEFLEDHCMVENTKEKENGEESTFAFDFVYLPIDFRLVAEFFFILLIKM
jgi:hypothetical protein